MQIKRSSFGNTSRLVGMWCIFSFSHWSKLEVTKSVKENLTWKSWCCWVVSVKKGELLNGGCKWRSTFQDDNLWNEIFLWLWTEGSWDDLLRRLWPFIMPLQLWIKMKCIWKSWEKKNWLDGVLVTIVPILTILTDFLLMKGYESPIYIKKHWLIFPT